MTRFADLEEGIMYAYQGIICTKEITYGEKGRIAYGQPLPCYGKKAVPMRANDKVELIGTFEVLNQLDLLIANKRISDERMEIPKRLPPYRKFMAVVDTIRKAKRENSDDETRPMGKSKYPSESIRKLFGCRRGLVTAAYKFDRMDRRTQREFRLWAIRNNNITQLAIEGRVRHLKTARVPTRGGARPIDSFRV